MKKTFLLLLLVFTTLSAFSQSGTSISYTDQFGSLTLTYNNLINGKHSYLGPDGTKARWSGTRWEVRYNNDTEILYFSNANTSMNPPNLAVGNWQIGPNGGGILMTTFSGTGTTATILPIELVEFDVNTEGGKNLLSWLTASEKDNSHFDIERSTDGTTFHNIGQVRGNNKPSSYQYVDASPFTLSYYRLKQVDFDGTATYSKVVSIAQQGKGKGLKVYPTLVSNGTLNFVIAEATEGGQLRDFSITNLLGQQVLSGKTTQQIDVRRLSQGTYVLKVGTEVAKFVKQ
jgi:hypothetical protein